MKKSVKKEKPKKTAKKAVAKKTMVRARTMSNPSEQTMGMKPQNKGNFDEYEVRDAANTIARAEEHKANKPLMKAVQEHVKRLINAVGGK